MSEVRLWDLFFYGLSLFHLIFYVLLDINVGSVACCVCSVVLSLVL